MAFVVSTAIADFMDSADATSAREAIGSIRDIIEFATDNPEGSEVAEPKSFGYATDGALWYKATGSGNTGWEQISGEQTLDGGSF